MNASHPNEEADFNNDVELFDEAVLAEDAATSEPTPTRDEELESMRRAVEDANKRVLQAQAEAENFRKRMRRDTEDQLRFASLPLVSDILQVRDNLLRAIDAAGADGSSGDAFRDGVQMVVKQFDDTLFKFGVTEIVAAGEPFDPNVHQAISQLPSNDFQANTIMQVATPGFLMHERVLRPALVVVSTGASDS